MNNLVFLLIAITCFSCATAPPTVISKTEKSDSVYSPEPEKYRSAYLISNDLVHTKLHLSFDWQKKQLIGEAELTLHPHFYLTDSLFLDAKGMDIQSVKMINGNVPDSLSYSYDKKIIRIYLGKKYSRAENYSVLIKYISKPEDLEKGGSIAIREDKGLYFINADSLDPEKPKEVWTQGETESNSVWFPTIEDPQQKMTQEIYITVDSAMKTLSNGLLISSVKNNDGTRTDYWKQSLPASPYLTMIAAGPFSIVKDKWRDKEVSYYLDPAYVKYAPMVFSHTPEMIEYFSNLLRVDFAWEKFSQVVVHDYVSGAMENTTAVVHGTNMQEDSSEYVDGNYEDYISHELFHHWFGDLVTCRSWSNITLNESFANYAEYLWREHKFGRENADQLRRSDDATYFLATAGYDPALARYIYSEREEVYDAVSYNKGGTILHMLRTYLGDDAFFTALHNYLADYRFRFAEVDQLREEFEKVSGEDLHWFFNQWYFHGGHPVLNISYSWNDSLKKETVTIKQKQDFEKSPLYRLPMDVDVYTSEKTERHHVICEKAEEEFSFDVKSKPLLVNVDATKTLLCKKNDEKSNEEWIYQYYHAPLYNDRMEAVLKIGIDYRINTAEASMMKAALHDHSSAIKISVIKNIGEIGKNSPDSVKDDLIFLAENDSAASVRTNAVKAIEKYYHYSEMKNFYEEKLNDISYDLRAECFSQIIKKDTDLANRLAPSLEKDSGSAFMNVLTDFYSQHPEKDKFDYFTFAILHSKRFYRVSIIEHFGKYINGQNDLSIIQKGINFLSDLNKKYSALAIKKYSMAELNNISDELKLRVHSLDDSIQDLQKSSGHETEIMEKKNERERINSLKISLDDTISSLDKNE